MNKNFLILCTLLMLVHTDAFCDLSPRQRQNIAVSSDSSSDSLKKKEEADKLEAALKQKEEADKLEAALKQKEEADKLEADKKKAEKDAAEQKERTTLEEELSLLKADNAKVNSDINRFKNGEALPESVKKSLESLKFEDFFSNQAIKAMVKKIASGAEDPAPGVFGKMYAALKINPTKIGSDDRKKIEQALKAYESKKEKADAIIGTAGEQRTKELLLRSILDLIKEANSFSSLSQKDMLQGKLQSIKALSEDESIPAQLKQEIINKLQHFDGSITDAKHMSELIESVKSITSAVQKHHQEAQQALTSAEQAMKSSEKFMKIINNLQELDKELSKKMKYGRRQSSPYKKSRSFFF